jgi:hypothetical protein
MIDPETYCREIEAYLCRKNDGHLIRIVGPAFEQVSQWAQEGIPLKVAFVGIDRYFERYYRRGPRRRPVRIEFCEADVHDGFDEWRRSIGVTLPVAGAQATTSATADEESESARRGHLSLAAHIERAAERLTALRGNASALNKVDDALERAARDLEALRSDAKRARGDARQALINQLELVDQSLMTAVIESLDETVRKVAEIDARDALSPFRDRMAPDAYQRACVAAFERYVRDHFNLPTIAFER